MNWRVYYGDGTTFGSDQGSPVDAPPRDVQVIAQTDADTGFEMLCGKDYYVWRSDLGRWDNVDYPLLIDYLYLPGWKRVLFGRTIASEEYAAIVYAAQRDFGSKSAWKPGERRP